MNAPPDIMRYLRGALLTVAIMALAGIWQSFSAPMAGAITALIVLIALSWCLRSSFAALFGTQTQSTAGRSLAHRSEPLENAISITPEQAQRIVSRPLIDDNPFAPVVQEAGGAGVLRLHAIADADNILVVGAKGSGKTTLVRALLRIRHGEHLSLDPHNAPGKWPCQVVGGGRNFADIDKILQGSYHGLNRRYRQLNSGEVREGQFKRHTLVGDEWRAISQELPGERPRDGKLAKMSAGEVLIKLLTEGRKVGLCMLAASHNDTAASMGMAGDMGILTCFDWIIYLGGLAVRKLPEAARQQRPAVAYDPERNVCFLLDVDDALQLAGPIVAPIKPQTDPEALRAMLNQAPASAKNFESERKISQPVSASGSHENGYEISLTPGEIAKIAAAIARNENQTAVVKSIPGYRADRHIYFVAKYRELKDALEA